MSDEPQNIYDDPDFFAGYRKLREDDTGLNAMEQPAVRGLLPNLQGLDVLDLGCGFGTFAAWACGQGARSVIGVDSSSRMLEAAVQAECVSYVRAAIEEADFEEDSFDCVVSSLALHYVADFAMVARRVARWLRLGGSFVFSVEHPIATAHAGMPGWITDADGSTRWQVDDYAAEGAREQEWFVPGVRKYHRMIATYINQLTACGLVIDRVEEPIPSDDQVAQRPDLAQDQRRPAFLIVACHREKR